MKNSNSESLGKITAPYLSKLKNVFDAVNDHQYTSLEKKKMFKQYKYMIYYLLTSSVRSLQGNLRPRPWWFGLIFPCNERTDEINKLFDLLNTVLNGLLWNWAWDQLRPKAGQGKTFKLRHPN